MTKAQERAAQIAANKAAAYAAKVRGLTGQLVSNRLAPHEIAAAYDSGRTAEEFAAMVASQEPVGKVVWPLKIKAVDAASQKAHLTINKVRMELEAVDWSINAVAPYPRDVWGRAAGAAAKAKYSLFHQLTEEDKAATSAWHAAAPEDEESRRAYFRAGRQERVVMSERGMERFVAQAQARAAFEYDAFVCKLVNKVGDVVDAELMGDHVWSYSVLKVTKREGGETFGERWKTQQIWNVSVLGNHFPQWPTRLMK